MANQVRVWDTSKELSYLHGIGNHAVPTTPITRIQLLKNYLKAAAKRVDWGYIDKATVVEAAKRLLVNLEAEASAVV